MVRDLVKEFHRPKRVEGRFGGLRTMFTRERVTKRAVDGISFTLQEGELVGYLGPNGAGKSTTVKMLAGILVPTSGTVEVAGAVPWRDRSRNARQIGLVFGQRSQLWWDLPLRESLRLIGDLYEVPDDRYRLNLAHHSELLELGPFLDTPVRQLSLGQRMRGDLAAALLYEPRVLYLDEPTVGLDVVARDRIRGFIAELNRERGTTVVLTTHDLDEVERLCDRIVLIDQGRVLFDGGVEALKSRFPPHRELVMRLAGQHIVPDVPGTVVREAGEGRWAVRFDPAVTPAAALVAELLRRYAVADLSVQEARLEDVVHRLYTEPAHVPPAPC
ncbi:ATP-binding cassette domain-containing protein [Amycolatopsis magusensis]